MMVEQYSLPPLSKGDANCQNREQLPKYTCIIEEIKKIPAYPLQIAVFWECLGCIPPQQAIVR